MLPITNIALSGLSAAETRMTARAQNIVNANTPGFEPVRVHQTSTPAGPVVRLEGGGQNTGYPNSPNPVSSVPFGNKVNLAAEVVDFKMAETSYKAGLAVLKSADEMQRSVIEILT